MLYSQDNVLSTSSGLHTSAALSSIYYCRPLVAKPHLRLATMPTMRRRLVRQHKMRASTMLQMTRRLVRLQKTKLRLLRGHLPPASGDRMLYLPWPRHLKTSVKKKRSSTCIPTAATQLIPLAVQAVKPWRQTQAWTITVRQMEASIRTRC